MELYLLLGLEPGATTADIKRSYRRLARRFHPGINPGDRAAEQMYRRISEAYETLVDPERRRAYDTGTRPAQATAASFEFAGFDFSAAAQGPQAATFTELFADVLHPMARTQGYPEPGADIHATLIVPFEDAMRGVERHVVVTRQEACVACAGAGHVRTSEARCAPCQGTGKVSWARGHMLFAKACAACHGHGRLRTQRCGSCAGHGRQVRSESVAVVVPPGVHDGARLRVAERGHAGSHGGRTGDLYVTIHVKPHALFHREGDDLRVTLPIGIHEAVLGARVEAPSLDGPVRLRIPPGTRGGQRFRLRGRGVPTPAGGRGDLVVETRLVLPDVVDERGKELMREFGRLYPADLRSELRTS